MLIALLLQAAVAIAPQPQPQPQLAPPARPRSPDSAAVMRDRRCNARVIEAMAPAMSEPALRDLARRLQAPRTLGMRWIPENYPEAGFYAAVERQVDGCSVPTPIYLPNAGPPAPKR